MARTNSLYKARKRRSILNSKMSLHCAHEEIKSVILYLTWNIKNTKHNTSWQGLSYQIANNGCTSQYLCATKMGNSTYKIRSVVVDEWYREKVGESLAHLIKAIRIKATVAAVCVLSTIVPREALSLRFELCLKMYKNVILFKNCKTHVKCCLTSFDCFGYFVFRFMIRPRTHSCYHACATIYPVVPYFIV